MNNFLVLLIIVGLGFLALTGAIGVTLANMPGFEQIELANTVIGQDGDQYVILRGRTLYNVLDAQPEDGCYQLTEPVEPGGRGTARKVWLWCGW